MRNRIDRIIIKLKNLVELALLTTSKVKCEKLGYETKRYQLTFGGHFVLLFALRDDNRKSSQPKLDERNKVIYSTVLVYLNNRDPSFAIFTKQVIERCFEEGQIDILFDKMLESLK